MDYGTKTIMINGSPIHRLIFELGKLPGIGERTATRLAYFILKQPTEYAEALSEAILETKQSIHLCARCLNLTSISPCEICSDPSRDQTVLCIVERPSDVTAIE